MLQLPTLQLARDATSSQMISTMSLPVAAGRVPDHRCQPCQSAWHAARTAATMLIDRGPGVKMDEEQRCCVGLGNDVFVSMERCM